MYTKPVGDIVRQHDMRYHGYADDSELYMVIKPKMHWTDVAPSVEMCISKVSVWMSLNYLKLNQDKTEFIVFASQRNVDKLQDLHISVGPNVIHNVPWVRNLGFVMDTCLTMEKQVNAITKACYYQIRNIGQIRKSITEDACKTLVQALVTSRLDYGNALLYNLPDKLTRRLQLMQNNAARLVSSTRKRDHITPVLVNLHWLPVQYRSHYKILLYTYKALHGLAPSYLAELIQRYCPTRSLRSESKSLLVVPKTLTFTYGSRCFSQSAATLWNPLPDHVKDAKSLSQFKSNLKTHLFKKAYFS